MTKREMFTATINVLATIEGTEELVQGLTHEIEMLDKKAASKSDKPTEKQEENAMFAREILQILESATEPMTIKLSLIHI